MGIQRDIQNKTLELKNILGNISDDPSITLEKKTQIIVHGTALICAIIAVQPLPFADLFILTPIQIIMVISLSRALGNPLSDTGAKEIVSYLIGVVGWGVLAQQVILGLYKTVIPFAGGFTTIPLVYATTYGLGIASKTILEAKMNGKKVSNGELKRITKVAKEEIKRENKIDWTPKGLKIEWEVISQRSKEYEEYKTKLNYYESEIFGCNFNLLFNLLPNTFLH